MDNEFPYDDELNGENLPTLAEFEQVIRGKLQGWLDYLRADPPLADLKDKASEIMQDLGSSTFISEVTPLATELAVAVGEKFARLKLWKSWHTHLLELFSPAVDNPSEEVQEAFHQCWMRLYLYKGDMIRASLMITSLLRISKPNPETKLAEARVAIALARYDDGLKMAEEMLTIALASRSERLLGRVYSVLTHFYLNRSEGHNAFQYGQMVYSVGIHLHDHTLISDGLHFMALAFKISEQPQCAFKYLELATQYSLWSDDLSHIDYLWDTWATCYLSMSKYSEAEYFFRISLRIFEGSGDYHARALHGLGISLVLLKRYTDAEPILDAAQLKWRDLKRPIEQLYIAHALAELYSCTARHSKAITLMEATIAEAEVLADRCPDGLRDLLCADLKQYIARRDDPDSSKNAVC